MFRCICSKGKKPRQKSIVLPSTNTGITPNNSLNTIIVKPIKIPYPSDEEIVYQQKLLELKKIVRLIVINESGKRSAEKPSRKSTESSYEEIPIYIDKDGVLEFSGDFRKVTLYETKGSADNQ